MSDYSGFAQRTWDSGSDTLTIKVFAEDAVSQSDVETAYDAVERAVNDVYYDNQNAPNIDSAKTVGYETTADFSCPDNSKTRNNEDTIRSEANDWLDNHDFNDRGCCLWITDCATARTWNNAWTERTVGVLGASYYSYLDVMAVHEAFHAYINHSCSSVQDLTDGNEHDLSTVTGSDELTPLGASYGYSKKHHKDGICSGKNFNTRRKKLSECAIQAVSESLEHKNAWLHDV